MKAICKCGNEMRPGRERLDRKGRTAIEVIWICRACNVAVHLTPEDGKVGVEVKPLRQLWLPEETS